MTVIVLGESLSWAIPAALGSALAGIAVTSSVGVEDCAIPYLATASIAAAAGLGAVLGTLLTAVTIKERHLFRFFKDRQ